MAYFPISPVLAKIIFSKGKHMALSKNSKVALPYFSIAKLPKIHKKFQKLTPMTKIHTLWQSSPLFISYPDMQLDAMEKFLVHARASSSVSINIGKLPNKLIGIPKTISVKPKVKNVIVVDCNALSLSI